jgi:hypothetical protein
MLVRGVCAGLHVTVFMSPANACAEIKLSVGRAARNL